MSKEILLILDLDETLIHASTEIIRDDFDFQVYRYFIYKRPGLDAFLRFCAQHFKLAIWSSASDDYVNAVVQQIFPSDVSLEFVWARSRCTPFLLPQYDEQGFYNLGFSSKYEFAKRLKKVTRQGFNLQRILIVDDTPEKVLHNYGNAIYAKPYYGDANDRELAILTTYLLALKDAENVRTIEKRHWRQQVLA
jgi:RNA polymerase II subunit A small phosphatase-like protein